MMRDPVLLATLGIAAALRLYGIDHGLPFVYNPDEVNIMARALSVARGLDPGYYLYPSFFFYFLFAVMGGMYVVGRGVGRYESVSDFQARFFTDPTDFFVVGRLVGVVCALATVVLTYRLADKHFGRTAARASAVFVAVAFFHVRDAHYLKHDVPSGLLFVLALVAIDRAVERRTPWSYGLAGLALGLGFATHYYMIFLAPALVIAHVVRRGLSVDGVRHVAISAVVSAATFFVLSPFVLLRFGTALEHMRANRQVVVDRSLDTGTSLFPSLPAYVDFLATQGLGYLLLVLVVVGAVLMAVRSRDHAVLWLPFPLMFFAFITYTFFAGRYLNPILPSLAVSGGYAVAVLGRRFGNTAAVAVAALACLQPLYRDVQMDRLFAGEDTRTVAREWILQNVAGGSGIAIQSYSVPLPQTAESFRDSLEANGALSELDKAGKYASLLEVATTEPVAYELLFLGAGDEPNRVYFGYDDLAGGFTPLTMRGAGYLVLRRPPIPPPRALASVFERARREGRALHVVTPFADGADRPPYLDNEDWAPSSRLTHRGPEVEIWELPPAIRRE